jgi:hypothetical protein
VDDFNLEKLAKEIVIDCLTGVEDAPSGAGEFARQILINAIVSTQSRQTPRDSVQAVCRGLMSGMLLLKKDLPRAAVAILGQMSAVAVACHQDPSELMSWALEGIAPIAMLAGGRTRDTVEAAVETAFMGAGRNFARACEGGGIQ